MKIQLLVIIAITYTMLIHTSNIALKGCGVSRGYLHLAEERPVPKSIENNETLLLHLSCLYPTLLGIPATNLR